MWRTPEIDRALIELEAYVRASWKPIGIIVAGSIVRGEAGPTSDLDVCVVHEEPWRVRAQRRFAGVPAELFVNPPAQIRRYFSSEHAEGQPSSAHMFATGALLGPSHPVVDELMGEARAWLARPLAFTPAQHAARRYAAVDLIDDARDVIEDDAAAAHLLLASAVSAIIASAFLERGVFQPRRKQAVTALGELDPVAGELARRWATTPVGADALAVVSALARQVLGVDSFFDWTSDVDPVVAG